MVGIKNQKEWLVQAAVLLMMSKGLFSRVFPIHAGCAVFWLQDSGWVDLQ